MPRNNIVGVHVKILVLVKQYNSSNSYSSNKYSRYKKYEFQQKIYRVLPRSKYFLVAYYNINLEI